MLMDVKTQNGFNREILVEDVIKYRIKKYGDCRLKLVFTTIAGNYYKDQAIKKFDGSLINTCQGLLKENNGDTIAVDGIYNMDSDSYVARPFLIFKRGIAAANLEYIETLDFKNPNLDSDVKMCIINSIIDSKDSHKLLDPNNFAYLIDALNEVNPLDYKVDLKNTISLLEFISANIKCFVKQNISYQGSQLKASKISNDKLDPKKALAMVEDLTFKYERLNNNDLIMAIYKIVKRIKDFDKDKSKMTYEIM